MNIFADTLYTDLFGNNAF